VLERTFYIVLTVLTPATCQHQLEWTADNDFHTSSISSTSK